MTKQMKAYEAQVKQQALVIYQAYEAVRAAAVAAGVDYEAAEEQTHDAAQVLEREHGVTGAPWCAAGNG